jgi:hydroxymethylpyrimidine kinase/phosphomethylpyrimidine kinase
MLKGFAASVITALTAQNTCGVRSIHPVPVAFIKDQLEAVFTDIQIDAIKSGMLFDTDIINMVASMLPADIPYILDTVMIAKGGASLLQDSAIDSMKHTLFPKALLITPNLPELQALCGGVSVNHARTLITDYGCQNVLIKGGHDTTENVTDILVTKDTEHHFSLPRIITQAGHGTGCSLSAALACYIAQGFDMPQAVHKAKEYVYHALHTARPIGKGHHPLNHNYVLGVE